ncbi:MAG TPA: ABC transporter ATP-binding protein [Planctomycetota bacterium]|nr:ABC transporter ATP-binding protein [Planctomycetota bacterium]
MSVLLEVRDLAKAYGDTAVFAGLSFTIAAGETVAVVGPSGCGKSTLLNCLGGLDRPTGGSVQLDGRDLTTLNDDALAAVRASTINFVFQDHHLLPQLSALENVLLPTLALAKKPDESQVRAAGRELLAKVGLTGKEDRLPAQLSGGERQRVALARALINNPKLILADEPTGALDVANAVAVADVLLTLNRDTGTALVVVTHSPALAARMSRQIDFARGVPA